MHMNCGKCVTALIYSFLDSYKASLEVFCRLLSRNISFHYVQLKVWFPPGGGCTRICLTIKNIIKIKLYFWNLTSHWFRRPYCLSRIVGLPVCVSWVKWFLFSLNSYRLCYSKMFPIFYSNILRLNSPTSHFEYSPIQLRIILELSINPLKKKLNVILQTTF